MPRDCPATKVVRATGSGVRVSLLNGCLASAAASKPCSVTMQWTIRRSASMTLPVSAK